MNPHFESAFNEVFNDPANCIWRQGFSDAKKGVAPQSNDNLYLEGYALGYEKGEKESGKCQSI